MSLHSVGASPNYVLPASASDVPQAWKSNASAKPIECSLQTTNVPALSGDQGASGTTNIQLSLGSGSGIILNPYLRFNVSVTTATTAEQTIKFKGPNALATACINTYTTFINSVQADQIANADHVYEQLLSHGSSNDFMAQDASILMNRGRATETAATGVQELGVQVVPLLGCLGSQQGFPAYLCSGTLQISIQWNSVLRAFQANVTAGGAIGSITSYRIYDVQLVYDKISPEGSFVEAMKREMDMGQKYVLSYLNIENSAFPVASASASIQYGLNVSSLRACVASQVLVTQEVLNLPGLSSANALSQFAVSLDGRLLNSNTLSVTNGGDAVVFSELNKCFSRLFDASVTDVASVSAAGVNTFTDNFFAVGVSACRVNESLAFSGSKATQVSIQYTRSGGAAATLYLSFLSDRQVLIGSAGDITLVR
jgi:hypothetical protein